MSGLDYLADDLSAFIESTAKEHRLDPNRMAPLLDSIKKRVLARYEFMPEEAKHVKPIIMELLQLSAKLYVERIKSEEQKYPDITKNILTHHPIAVVGSGISVESDLPLERELFRSVCVALEFAIGGEWGVKCLAPDGSITNDCWRQIADNEKAYKRFRDEFIQVCNQPTVKPADSHKLLAKLFLNDRIKEIICLNWDNLIERAYRGLPETAGVDIPKSVCDRPLAESNSKPNLLWKIHGDVEDCEPKWTLPHESGANFPRALQERLTYYKSSAVPKSLLFIGWGEKEDKIMEQLKKYFEPSTLIIRIRPDLDPSSNEEILIATAGYALSRIQEEIDRKTGQAKTSVM